MLYVVTRRLKNISHSILSKSGSFHQVMIESLGNINTVQAFCREKHEEQRFNDATQAMRNFGLKFIFYTSLSKPIIEFLGLGMLGTTIAGGAYLVLEQKTSLLGIPICSEPLSVSALLVFFGMLVGLSDPLRKLSAVYSSVYAGSIAANGLYGILDKANETIECESPQNVESPHRILRLENVSFGYAPNKTVLQNVSCDIEFGSTVVFIGHNGSGKSTLIHLLGRYYDPNEGQLSLDGVDFREMGIEDLRRRIAVVNQHTELFNDTIEYNIKYGRPEATQEEVIEAAKQAHAHEFIMQDLGNGYQTRVGQNGSKLSGGQRQRIALARALLCDPEILILDEATSQIDMQSEQLIRESLSEHRGQRTMIIITHREKLIELADRTFEIVDGRLQESTERFKLVA
jgi:ATP-binding cassette subfamily B protein/subfamily B ATP-binding cassette protein MsbA